MTGGGHSSAEAAREMNRQALRWNLTMRRSPGGQRRHVRGEAGALAVRSGFLAEQAPSTWWTRCWRQRRPTCVPRGWVT